MLFAIYPHKTHVEQAVKGNGATRKGNTKKESRTLKPCRFACFPALPVKTCAADSGVSRILLKLLPQFSASSRAARAHGSWLLNAPSAGRCLETRGGKRAPSSTACGKYAPKTRTCASVSDWPDTQPMRPRREGRAGVAQKGGSSRTAPSTIVTSTAGQSLRADVSSPLSEIEVLQDEIRTLRQQLTENVRHQNAQLRKTQERFQAGWMPTVHPAYSY